ncbi:DUF6518 family protein [Patulibacter defluvii]|uniref:DUF6518 family protein n=1 Tax=Patulibacter defluvii TaxID=3095358 RepID=UPI002A74D179|nr:DUF6518 family protein [Patulibacter sp. DM4]
MIPAVAVPNRSAAARPVPIALALIGVVVIALALGFMGRTTNNGAFHGSWEFSRLGGPWLVGAFAAGMLCGWRRGPEGLALGVVGGAIAIALGSLSYYGIYILVEDGVAARRAAKLGVGWAMAGVVVGGTLGLLGATLATRAGGRARVWLQGAAVGTLGGLLMGESIALLWVWDQHDLRVMATLEGLAGAALVALAAVGRSWRWIAAAVVAAAVTATVAPIVTTMVREALRRVGWAGA